MLLRNIYFTSEKTNNATADTAKPTVIDMIVTKCPRYCFTSNINIFTNPMPTETEPIKPSIPPIPPNTFPEYVVGFKAFSGIRNINAIKGRNTIMQEIIVLTVAHAPYFSFSFFPVSD